MVDSVKLKGVVAVVDDDGITIAWYFTYSAKYPHFLGPKRDILMFQ
jgi:hypothetical protein